MTYMGNPHPVDTRAGALKALSMASRSSVSGQPATCNPDYDSALAEWAWFVIEDEENPAWSTEWAVENKHLPLEKLRAEYERVHALLLRDSDHERAHRLTWALHDAVRWLFAERQWVRRYPQRDGAFRQNEARQRGEHQELERRARARRTRAGVR